MRQVIKKLIVFLFVMNIVTFVYAQDKKAKAIEYYQMGNIYYKQGRYEEAQAEFQKALDIISSKEETPVTKTTEVKEPEKKTTPTPSQASKPSLEYIIGEEDVLGILVWQNPDLSQDAIVRPDGKISFPLVRDVQASGLTITQLDEEITQRLKEYIKYPEVSISIKKLGGKKVIVLGEIKNPGVYSVTGAKTILEAVGLAGGFTKDAVSSSVVVIRGGFEKPEAIRVSLNKALSGNLRQNIALQSEDIVFVPKKFIADLNYFLNQIIEPLSKGAYTKKELMMW